MPTILVNKNSKVPKYSLVTLDTTWLYHRYQLSAHVRAVTDTKVAQGLVGLVSFEIPITVHVKLLENQQAIYVGL
jgi:hypothetical protein